MLFSLVMYFSLFPLWCRRRSAFVETRKFARATRDLITRVDLADVAARVAFSYYLLSSCICIWTVFVVTFFFAGAAKLSGLETREAPSWPFCVDAAVDLLAKLLYSALIVDAHGSLFDSAELSERRLEELRDLLHVVWTASSDALAVSVRYRDLGPEGVVRVDTSVSPTVEAMMFTDSSKEGDLFLKKETRKTAHSMVAALHGDKRARPEWQVMRFSYADCHASSSQNASAAAEANTSTATWERTQGDEAETRMRADSAETSGFAALTRRAWRSVDKTGQELYESRRLVHKLIKNDGSLVECEATVTHLGLDRLVIVVRDISERAARHEAEKQLAVVKATCERDSERDARHEVEKELLSQKTARESDAPFASARARTARRRESDSREFRGTFGGVLGQRVSRLVVWALSLSLSLSVVRLKEKSGLERIPT